MSHDKVKLYFTDQKTFKNFSFLDMTYIAVKLWVLSYFTPKANTVKLLFPPEVVLPNHKIGMFLGPRLTVGFVYCVVN